MKRIFASLFISAGCLAGQAQSHSSSSHAKQEEWGFLFEEVFDESVYLNHLERLNLDYRFRNLYLFFDLENEEIDSGYEQEEQLRWRNADGATRLYSLQEPGANTHTYMLQGGFAFEWSPRHSFGASYRYGRTTHGRWATEGTDVLYRAEAAIDSLDNSKHHNRRQKDISVNAYYTGRLGKHLDINVQVDYLAHRKDHRQTASEHFRLHDVAYDIRQDGVASHRMRGAHLHLAHPFLQGRLSGGIRYTGISLSQTALDAAGFLPGTHTYGHERRTRGFLAYTRESKYGTLEAGIDYEYTDFSLSFPAPEPVAYNRADHHVLPHVRWSIPYKEVEFQVGYGSRLLRPAFAQQIGYTTYANPFIYEQGNPELETAEQHDFYVQTTWKWLEARAGYQHTRNDILHDFTPVAGHPQAYTGSYVNRNTREVYAALTLAPQTRYWDSELTAHMHQSLSKHPFAETHKRPSAFLEFEWNNDFKLPAGWTVTGNYYYQPRGTRRFIEYGSTANLTVGVGKTFFNDALTCSIQAVDVLDQTRIQHTEERGGFQRSFERAGYEKCYLFSLSYRFNTGKRGYRGGQMLQADAERL